MNYSAEFSIETLTLASKNVYRLTLPFGVDVEQLNEQIVLASSGLASTEDVNSALESWLQGGRLMVPVLAARGHKQGETLVVTSGVHGDEYEGMEAIYRTFEAVDPQQMQGTLICVPVVTLPAFWLGTRFNPVDSHNLARVFPGLATGSPSEQLADAILQRVLRHATLYVDLHSAGRNYHMLTLCGYCSAGSQSSRAAEAAARFGAPVIWEHLLRFSGSYRLCARWSSGFPRSTPKRLVEGMRGQRTLGSIPADWAIFLRCWKSP